MNRLSTEQAQTCHNQQHAMWTWDTSMEHNDIGMVQW